MRRIAVVAVGGLILAACGSSSGGSTAEAEPERNLSGTFTLSDTSGILAPNGKETGSVCIGKGGYDDIAMGLQVVVSDGDGKVLTTGQLGLGEYEKNPDYPILGECVFSLVTDGELPEAEFYKVAVGRRGELTYSYDEMVTNGWTVQFNLG